MSEKERCDLCGRETWASRMRYSPPVEHEDMDKFCLGSDSLYRKPCNDATRARIAALETRLISAERVVRATSYPEMCADIEDHLALYPDAAQERQR